MIVYVPFIPRTTCQPGTVSPCAVRFDMKGVHLVILEPIPNCAADFLPLLEGVAFSLFSQKDLGGKVGVYVEPVPGEGHALHM